jgi:predicted RNase H-like HicB family nuclease
MKERVEARIRRDKEGNWLVTFPAIKGAHTYGRSLSELRRRMPEVLRLWDHDPARVDVVEVLDLPTSLGDAIQDTSGRRRELEAQVKEVQRSLQRMVARLQKELGLGVRDTGELLGISPQYAHKLRRTARSTPRRPQRKSNRKTSTILRPH